MTVTLGGGLYSEATVPCCLLTLVSFLKKVTFLEWWLTSVILVLKRLEKDSYEFKAGLGYRMRPSVKAANEVLF